ncbi:MAG: bifunctional methionine sulfoxide reductase B/A protein [Bacteroidota bacterium]
MLLFSQCSHSQENKPMKQNKLTPEEEKVIINKGTERPFAGKYWNSFEEGTYTCKNCGAPLYKSSDKFKSECGWPSFDDEISGAVKRVPDADGNRTEIVCDQCGGHLGHVFEGEQLTDKNTRHCVNSISMNFIPVSKNDTAVVAGGCFWGVEYYMQKMPGVISSTVGYTGGKKEKPTYEEVCSHNTGHAEAVEIVFDPAKTSYENVIKAFFELHDFTQINRQGPDIGEQYRSEIYFKNETQKEAAENLIKILQGKGYKVATKLTKASYFWSAEEYHQDYYDHKGSTPYCHKPKKIF